jgi:hypothetical protein
MEGHMRTARQPWILTPVFGATLELLDLRSKCTTHAWSTHNRSIAHAPCRCGALDVPPHLDIKSRSSRGLRCPERCLP